MALDGGSGGGFGAAATAVLLRRLFPAVTMQRQLREHDFLRGG